MIRGEIWTVAGHGYASKPRPALVIQHSWFDATSSITVVLFTSTEADLPLLRIPVIPSSSNGLHDVSFLMIDKVTTMPRYNVKECIGVLSTSDLQATELALGRFLGLD